MDLILIPGSCPTNLIHNCGAFANHEDPPSIVCVLTNHKIYFHEIHKIFNLVNGSIGEQA